MATIYESVKGLITQDMLGKAKEVLGEDQNKIASAVSTIIPALLGRLLDKGVSPKVLDVIQDAGQDKLLARVPELFEGHGLEGGKNLGERMENALIGPKNVEFPTAIAAKYELREKSADRLTNWVSGVIAAYFGDRMVRGKESMTDMLEELGKEKSKLAADIPHTLYSKLGLNSIFGTPASSASKSKPEAKKKRRFGWLWWLLLILLLVLLFCWWRSCHRSEVVVKETVTVTQVETPKVTENARERIEHTLPSGEKIVFYRGGCEECVLNFLNSDRYKNATEADLKGTWFEFDNIDFVFNSTNELMPGSMEQLTNLAAILRAHPEAKMKIGGFADKTGTKAVNYEISKERAAFIKSTLAQNGIDASRVSTEGFGEEFATVPADASNAERAKDRDIALRFTK